MAAPKGAAIFDIGQKGINIQKIINYQFSIVNL
jgi:hypothetical protein